MKQGSHIFFAAGGGFVAGALFFGAWRPEPPKQAAPGKDRAPAIASRETGRLRSDLARLQKERDDLEARLKDRELQIRLLERLSSTDDPTSKGKEAAKSKEEVAKQVAAIRGDFEAAFQSGDGKKILALLKELAGLGEDAFPDLAALVQRAQEEGTRLRINQSAFEGLRRSLSTEFWTWAFSNSEVPSQLRGFAMAEISNRNPEQYVEQFGGQLLQEKEYGAAIGMLLLITSSFDKRAPGALAKVALENPNPDIRGQAWSSLLMFEPRKASEEVAEVIQRLPGILASERDPVVLETARRTLEILTIGYPPPRRGRSGD